jgi:hypothetical protein
VLTRAERVAAADPDDGSPIAAAVGVVAAYASWMAGDVATSVASSERATEILASPTQVTRRRMPGRAGSVMTASVRVASSDGESPQSSPEVRRARIRCAA